VHFLGRRTDVVDILRCADLLAHAAEAEPFGLVLAEAQACGVAVVSSDGGGAPEVVGDAGLLVPSGDVAALRDAIAALLADEPRRAELAARGRAQAERIGDSATQAARLAEMYRRVVG
jgi:glycosyltransferase involved in cell wall biosynthesis